MHGLRSVFGGRPAGATPDRPARPDGVGQAISTECPSVAELVEPAAKAHAVDVRIDEQHQVVVRVPASGHFAAPLATDHDHRPERVSMGNESEAAGAGLVDEPLDGTTIADHRHGDTHRPHRQSWPPQYPHRTCERGSGR